MHPGREAQGRDRDAVRMLERRARVLARQGGDLVGIAEQEAQHVEMVHAHVGQRQPVIILQETLPVRDRVHVDLGKDDLAEIAPDR